MQILENVFNYLDAQSIKTVRLVCSEWKSTMDKIGLHIIINDTLEGNADFGRKANIKHATIQHVERLYKYLVFKYPESCLVATCTDYIEPAWFFDKLLKKCKNLTKLDLTGKFLFSQELDQILTTVKTRNPIAEAELIKLQQYKIHLPNLKTLQMIVDAQICRNYIDESESHVKFNCFGLFSGDRTRSLKFLRKIIDRNVTLLLQKIRSPVLKILYIAVDPMSYLDPGVGGSGTNNYEFHYKGIAIDEFLDYHRNTLQQLYLPYYQKKPRSELTTTTAPANQHKENLYLFPTNLKVVELTLSETFGSGHHRHSHYTTDKILLNQTRLEQVRFEKPSYENCYKDTLHFIPLILSNYHTLTYLNLTVNSSDCELLNGKVFQNCTKLQTFIMADTPDKTVEFINITYLPKSLKHLEIWPTTTICEYEELNEMKKFEKLESLLLYGILISPAMPLEFLPIEKEEEIQDQLNKEDEAYNDRSSSNNNNDEPYVFNLILDLLRLRELNELGLDFIHALKNNDEAEDIIELITTLLGPSCNMQRNEFEQFHTLEIHGYFRDSEKNRYEGHHRAKNFLDVPAPKRHHGGPTDFKRLKSKPIYDDAFVASNIYNVPTILEQIAGFFEHLCNTYSVS